MIKAMATDDVIAPFRSDKHDHFACIEDALAVAEELCRKQRVSLTALRRRVLELIWGRHGPVGAYELLDQLRAERRGAAPPTIYRALDFLLENRLIHRIESLNAYVGCAGPATSHGGQFLICHGCGLVAELDDGAIARRVRSRAQSLGFTVERQTIEIMGMCPKCGAEAVDDAG